MSWFSILLPDLSSNLAPLPLNAWFGSVYVELKALSITLVKMRDGIDERDWFEERDGFMIDSGWTLP